MIFEEFRHIFEYIHFSHTDFQVDFGCGLFERHRALNGRSVNQ